MKLWYKPAVLTWVLWNLSDKESEEMEAYAKANANGNGDGYLAALCRWIRLNRGDLLLTATPQNCAKAEESLEHFLLRLLIN